MFPEYLTNSDKLKFNVIKFLRDRKGNSDVQDVMIEALDITVQGDGVCEHDLMALLLKQGAGIFTDE